MSKSVKCLLAVILTLLTVYTPVGFVFSDITAFAATEEELNRPNVFLKQQTSVTCTLASAAMLMRRTAICAGMESWAEITEENIRPVAWTNGVGLRWNFTYSNITIGHGYFAGDDNKTELLNLLEQYPQGLVIYNAGNEDQTHAVFLCDYDEFNDIFYVADPAMGSPEGRIPLIESTIKGETQEDQINNLDAFWYVVSPVVTVEGGAYLAPDVSSGSTDVPGDTVTFNQTKKKIGAYYVVADDVTEGAALRYYPSGSSTAYTRVNKGAILFVDSIGKNNFGAEWYKTESGYYIFSSNLVPYEDYSAEIVKFRNTAVSAEGTYSVSSADGVAELRLEPAEGNNIIAKIEKSTKLYIKQSGVNSVGAKWYLTQEGYYIKASEVEFVSSEKLSGADFKGELSSVRGEYRVEPVEDDELPAEIDPVEYKITASALNVRKYPVDGDILGMLSKGTVVKVSAILGNWGRIEYNSREAWISLEYAEKITNVVTPITIESIKINKDMVQTGEEIECVVKINSDVACMYRFSVYNSDGEKVFSNGSLVANNTFRYKTENPGMYYFYIDVVAGDGRTINGYSGNFSVHNKLQLESVKSNVDDKAFADQEIVWTVKTVSESSTSKFRYTLYFDGKILLEKDSLLPSFRYVPENAGVYQLKVYLEDEYSSSEEISSEQIIVVRELNIESVVVSASTAFAGESVECTVNAVGGKGEYKYVFSVFKDNQPVKSGSYVTNNKQKIVLEDAGTYRILCAVMDSESTIVSAFSSPIVVAELRPGDLDNDKKVTAIDARTVLRASAGMETLTPGQKIAADVNKDGKVNAIDARIILRCAANLEKL